MSAPVAATPTPAPRSRTSSRATTKTSAPPTAALSKTPAARTSAPPQDKVRLSPESQQPAAQAPGFINNLKQNFQQNEAGIGLNNRAAGLLGDNVPTLAPGMEKSVTAAIGIPGVTGPLSFALGGLNVEHGNQRMAEAQTAEEKGAGWAQLAQGRAQQIGGVTATTSAAAALVSKTVPQMAAPAAELAAGTGQLALRAAGPAVAALEATKNGFESVQAYKQGGDWVTPGYYAAAKGTSAALMTNPATAPVGGALLLGTSIGEQLNKTETVQKGQEWVADRAADMLGYKTSAPPVSQEELQAYRAQVQARRQARLEASQ